MIEVLTILWTVVFAIAVAACLLILAGSIVRAISPDAKDKMRKKWERVKKFTKTTVTNGINFKKKA